jgi:hypothetical protein
MFLKNCWYWPPGDHELIDGKLLARTILEEPVLLYKSETGKVVALKDRCCHRGAPLHLGRREGDCVRCMYHGLKFDPSVTPPYKAFQAVRPDAAGADGEPLRFTSTIPAATPPNASISWIVSGSLSSATPNTSANTGVRKVNEDICVAG